MSQYRTSIKILCAGHPTTESGDRRRICNGHLTTECSSWTVRKQHHEIVEKIRPHGWRSLKTLGKRLWLCPRCTNFVMKKRKESKERWG